MKGGAGGFDGEDDLDFAVGSVTGVRVWALRPEDTTLAGQNNYVWTDGENVAQCVHGCAQPPGDECACGFWAYWDMGAALVFKPTTWAVAGVVEGYGRTTIGERGFRSARARIVALCLAFDIYAQPASADGWYNVFGSTGRHPDELAIKAVIEDSLSQAYPSARIRTSRESMLAIHPTTKDYLPAVAEPETAAADLGWAPVPVSAPLTAKQQSLLKNWPGRVHRIG